MTDLLVVADEDNEKEQTATEVRRRIASQNNNNNFQSSSVNSKVNPVYNDLNSELNSFVNHLQANYDKTEESILSSAEKKDDLSGPSSEKLYAASINGKKFSQKNVLQNDEGPNNKLSLNSQIEPSLMCSNNFNSETVAQSLSYVRSFREFSRIIRTNGLSMDEYNQCGKLFNY